LREVVRRVFIEELIRAALDPRAAGPVRDSLEATLAGVVRTLEGLVSAAALVRDVERYLGRQAQPLPPMWVAPEPPPGSPIGAGARSGDASWFLAPATGHPEGGQGHAQLDGWGACGCGRGPTGLDS
jgi:hypothetical protein